MMAPLQLQFILQQHSCCLKKVLFLLYLLSLLLMNVTFISAAAAHSQHQRSRLLLGLKDDIDGDEPTSIAKKIKQPTSTSTKTTRVSSKNQTKLIKPPQITPKNQTKLIKPPQITPKNQTKLLKTSQASSKNQTKLIKPSLSSSKNQTKLTKSTPSDPAKNKTKSYNSSPKSQIKKLNSTSNSTIKGSKPTSPKNSVDLPKLPSPKNKTSKETKPQLKNSSPKFKSKSPIKTQARPELKFSNQITNQSDEEEDDDDPISEFRDFPYKFHETFVPDLERISKTSRMYLTNYNHEITKGVKPYVGNKYAPTVAPIASFAFIIIPLILVSLIFNRITAYFSLQKILIFIQFYLAMYFGILALSALVTGIEPLKFFYTASRSTYVGVQVLQTVFYVLYLLLLLMYLIVAFSSETGPGAKLLSLAQTLVGFAVGLHYYVTVFHRAVLHQPPKSGWKVNGVYATCFLLICLLGTAGKRKKAYLEEGGEEGKKS